MIIIHVLTASSSQKQKRRVQLFWPPQAEEDRACHLSVADQTKLSRYKSITAKEARAWQAILPGKHELSSETWCLLLQVWLGAPVYDRQIDGSNPVCNNCELPMDCFGRHSQAYCGSGYGKTARHNDIARAGQRDAFVLGGIPSCREEIGLFSDANNRPGDTYVTTEAGCSVAGYTSTAFDFTGHGSAPDNCQSSALLIQSCTIAGAAACDAEKSRKLLILKKGRKKWLYCC